jgi:rRNA-processing protein CGR1
MPSFRKGRFFVPNGILTKFQRRIQAIRDKRAAKAEKERYEKMAEKMHKRRVERLRRREKRNKLLKS